jgi:Flp pilus assembly protein TadG
MQRTRRRDSRGAALVESAIVLIPLCIIIFGIIEFGFIFKDSLSISNASRAGARTASAEPQNAGFYLDTVASVKVAGTAAGYSNGDKMYIYNVNQQDGINTTGGPGTCGTDCRVYTWSNGNWSGDTSATGNWPTASQKACLGTDIDSVGVELVVTHHSITGFFPFLNNLHLTEHTVMRLEPQESGSSCS